VDQVSVIADSVFAYNMVGNTLGLTVLRSAIYGDLRIAPINYEDDYDILSQGITEGSVRLAFQGEAWELADSFVNRPIIINESNHDGILPSEQQYCSLQARSAAIGAVKKAEYSDGVVVRIYEYAGNSQQVLLGYMDQRYELPLLPYEIKTVLIQNGQIQEVNMIENM
jgi:alpha-mannosidase